MPKLTAQLVMLIALVGLIALVVFAGPVACNKIRSMAAQGRVQHAQAQAQANSGADAVSTVAASGDASAASEGLTRSNEQQIRAAQGSNASVAPTARDAGLAALCRRNAYKDDPRCKSK